MKLKMIDKKEKKPNVTGRKLKAAGYRYKLSELTKEEKKIQREGIKETDPKTGREITFDPPDMNYYYKIIDKVTVKIFKVGDRFYYKNSWFRHMDKLPALEQLAKDDYFYDGMQAKMVDTKPLLDTHSTEICPENIPAGYIMIRLNDGPLHNQSKVWKESFPTFMAQFVDEDGKVKGVRYKRDDFNKAIYNLLDIIE
jgi:hypothetical protein